jgi:hypothetical protein
MHLGLRTPKVAVLGATVFCLFLYDVTSSYPVWTENVHRQQLQILTAIYVYDNNSEDDISMTSLDSNSSTQVRRIPWLL